MKRKSKNLKGVTLVETSVSLALFVIVTAVVATVLIGASRAGGRALKQMNYDSMKSNLEICLSSDDPIDALSLCFGIELAYDKENVLCFDDGFSSLCEDSAAAYKIFILVTENASHAEIYDVNDRKVIYEFDGQ